MTYWERIHDHFHARKDFETDRNPSSLSHRWGIIQESVNRFCGWYAQVQNRNQSGVTEIDKIEQAKELFQDKDQKKKAFTFMHCWTVMLFAQKWIDTCNSITQKKQKTCSNVGPSSYTPGTNESHHDDEEGGPSHTSPMKRRPDGKKKEKERQGKNSSSHGDTLYVDAMENLWTKREKAEELKEIKKEERSEKRLAVEKRRLGSQGARSRVEEKVG